MPYTVMTKSEIFRCAHASAASHIESSQFVRPDERRFRTYADAFAQALRDQYEIARWMGRENARMTAGLPKIIPAGTRAYAELATDGALSRFGF